MTEDTMSAESTDAPIVWITLRYGVNPCNVVSVFHGSGGQIDVTLVRGEAIHTTDRELTAEGKALLLPADRKTLACAPVA
jgi:hypothetical protein